MAKFCGKCGSKLDEKTGLCPKCANINTGYAAPKGNQPPEKQKNKKKSKKPLIITLVIIGVVLLALGAVVLLSYLGVINIPFLNFGADKKATNEEQQLAEGFEEYFELKKEINSIDKKYQTEDGYIKKSDAGNAIKAVEEYAKKLYDEKTITEYGADDNSVWFTLNSGLEFVYMPNIEGVDSMDISTYQPCLYTYNADVQEYSKNATDGSAETIDKTFGDIDFTNNFDNKDATLDAIKSIGSDQIVIWHGHGGYDTKHHSYLLTNIELDETAFLLDPIYYIKNIGYTSDYLSGKIICTSNGYVCVTYKFFDAYLDNLNNSFIYLGACSSGKDDVLPEIFINKGAETVFANTDVIHTAYNLDMIKSVCTKMTQGDSARQYCTANEALEFAREQNGEHCCDEDTGTRVEIWGDRDFRFSDELLPFTPEEAVKIYMDNKHVWMDNDVDTALTFCCYLYGFADLDFDGNLELIVSKAAGTGRFSYNKYYRIDTKDNSVKMIGGNDSFYCAPDDEFAEGCDYYSDALLPKLLKNKADGSMVYYCIDFCYASMMESGKESGILTMSDDYKLSATPMFNEYYYSDSYGNESTEYAYYNNGSRVDIDEDTYNKKVAAFMDQYTDLNVQFDFISMVTFNSSSSEKQKELLLDAYKNFTYEGYVMRTESADTDSP